MTVCTSLKCVSAALLALSLGCSSKKETPEDSQSKQKAAAEPERAPAIAPTNLPLEALAKVTTLPLHAEAPCSQIIDNARPALNEIGKTRKELAEDPENRNAPQILQLLAERLEAALPKEMPSNDEDDMTRVADEFRAALSDLAESAKLLSSALLEQNDNLAQSQKARIDNGVENLRASLEQLASLCPP